MRQVLVEVEQLDGFITQFNAIRGFGFKRYFDLISLHELSVMHDPEQQVNTRRLTYIEKNPITLADESMVASG
jgi:hypothetical protein